MLNIHFINVADGDSILIEDREGDRVFLELLLSGEKRFFSIRLLYEGDRLVDQTVHLY